MQDLGSARVVGLDFSEEAVLIASQLARNIGMTAEFMTADVYDAPAALAHRTFDIVYTRVGALCWLPDIEAWAKVGFCCGRAGGCICSSFIR